MTFTSLVSTERTASWIPSRTRSKNDAISCGQVDADPELLLGNEEARGQVRPVAERLGPLQDAAARLLVDSGSVVERAVHRPDRDVEALRNFADSRRLLPSRELLLAPGHFYLSHLDSSRRGHHKTP